MKKDSKYRIHPHTYIFGGKSAPAYYLAKKTIELINSVADVVNNDPETNEFLKVVFVENYDVSKAEIIIPAADISEQISTAGKEASGTGNMKFMINGALTIGTLDGANVEMKEACGDDNIFIFGLTAKEVDKLWAHGYNASEYYANNVKLEKVIKALNVGFNGQTFSDIANYLLTGSPVADPYMCLADFGSFCEIHEKADKVYLDKLLWAKKSLNNIATAGIFASDRSIREYADRIWGLKRIK